jgi:hypothetical protein
MKAAVRAIVFAHLRGIVLAPVVRALCDRGVFALFRDSTWLDLDHIAQQTRANQGYLRIALRLLVGAGWLRQRAKSYALTPEGTTALAVAPDLYREVVSFITMAIFLEDFLFGKSQSSVLPSMQVLVGRAIEGWGPDIPGQIRLHLDGMLVGPTMVALSRNGILNRLLEGPAELKTIDGNQSCLSALFDLLASRGWVTRDQNCIALTPEGRYAASIAPAYGVTISYLPMFSVISTLLFGNPRIPRVDEGSGV